MNTDGFMMTITIADLPHVQATITFLSAKEGGRRRLFPEGYLAGDFSNSLKGYKPHLVLDERDFERGKLVPRADPKNCHDHYMGVCFVGGPIQTAQWQAEDYTLLLMYYPKVDYSSLQPQARVAVREGGRTIGFGVILSRNVPPGEFSWA